MRIAMKPFGAFALTMAIIAAGCSTAPSSNAGRTALQDDVQSTIAKARNTDPAIERFFNDSVGYAVFPNVGKGGYVLGGAYGQGMLFENNQFTSYCSLTQATIGLQIGGQSYSEIIFFQTNEKLNDFKQEQLALAAQASAVALQVGAAANANYSDGVAVFTMGHGGLMVEASVGGQKFDVVSRDDASYAGDYQRSSGIGTASANRGYDSVYGYAGSDSVDNHWKHDSDYNRGYNANIDRMIVGEVVSISEFSPSRDAAKGRQITLRADDGQTYVVHTGPSNWMQRQDEKLRVREGDQVTVTGSLSRFNDGDVIMARNIRMNDGQVIEIRDAQGRGRWDLQNERDRAHLRDNNDPTRNQNDLNRNEDLNRNNNDLNNNNRDNQIP